MIFQHGDLCCLWTQAEAGAEDVQDLAMSAMRWMDMMFSFPVMLQALRHCRQSLVVAYYTKVGSEVWPK